MVFCRKPLINCSYKMYVVAKHTRTNDLVWDLHAATFCSLAVHGGRVFAVRGPDLEFASSPRLSESFASSYIPLVKWRRIRCLQQLCCRSGSGSRGAGDTHRRMKLSLSRPSLLHAPLGLLAAPRNSAWGHSGNHLFPAERRARGAQEARLSNLRGKVVVCQCACCEISPSPLRLNSCLLCRAPNKRNEVLQNRVTQPLRLHKTNECLCIWWRRSWHSSV